uniref:Elongation factor 1-beta n=1 Tax=Globodera rostochiensis TaxID=31243 RepID=A0A914GUG7_GLORO
MAQQQAHNGVAVTSKELTEFNNCLSSRAYLHGFLPSQEDQYVFKSLTMAPSAKEYPHIDRWYKHIKSYDDAERSAWPMKTGGSPQTVAAKEGTPAKKGDEDFDLFGDDGSDDEEKKRITEERLKAYAEKKAKKPGPVAKSNRKFVPSNKLQICCCVEDEKVSTDWLEEEMTGFEDLVQSVDVVAFNKV